jgi:predicted HTH domain antitoxin
MTVTIPDEALGTILASPEQVRIELAAALYASNRATTGRAARIAGLSYLDMQRELCRRRIPMHYGLKEFEQDLQTLRERPLPMADKAVA